MTDAFTLPEPYSRLSVNLAATGALVTDPDGRVLMVKPHHNPHWTFLGGMLDTGETPRAGCGREIKEEIGLDLPVGRLLLADWAPPEGRRPLPLVYFLFDCGTLPGLDDVILQEDELSDIAFLPPSEAAARLAPHVAARLPAALAARDHHRTVWLPDAPTPTT
ncbi:ADP-ribose pyrophosphatase YjhB (NUDIX family) [Stackebrandtia albiflava]|uniref:ADP-ribose pyrophosphatase YjhB (NUDIX family) n=1 Tax=Stackebrandtia albiflava TaxID=406432 RepID=A0A562VCB7_9ACTN|nr:NUDIX hydrolase [Stackebrandtia albiflava]TWJ15524.1 ADP-ribose pyrophosphatase YjhB (NUDIX family) [Stackebrandtia albiflava]